MAVACWWTAPGLSALSKERARVDEWLPELGPSNELRKSFGHDPRRWGGVP